MFGPHQARNGRQDVRRRCRRGLLTTCATTASEVDGNEVSVSLRMMFAAGISDLFIAIAPDEDGSFDSPTRSSPATGRLDPGQSGMFGAECRFCRCLPSRVAASVHRLGYCKAQFRGGCICVHHGAPPRTRRGGTQDRARRLSSGNGSYVIAIELFVDGGFARCDSDSAVDGYANEVTTLAGAASALALIA